jgi:hypothetical protein
MDPWMLLQLHLPSAFQNQGDPETAALRRLSLFHHSAYNENTRCFDPKSGCLKREEGNSFACSNWHDSLQAVHTHQSYSGNPGPIPVFIELASANCLYTTIRPFPCQPFFAFRKGKSRALRGPAFC